MADDLVGPLKQIAQSLNAQTNLLAGIHASLLGGATGPLAGGPGGSGGVGGPQVGATTVQALNPATVSPAGVAGVISRPAGGGPVGAGGPPPGSPRTNPPGALPPTGGSGPGPAPVGGRNGFLAGVANGLSTPNRNHPRYGSPTLSDGSANPEYIPSDPGPERHSIFSGGGGDGSEGQGGGLVNRLFGSATRKMPMLTIPASINNEIMSQRAKNNWYRNVMGDSNGEAFRGRFAEEANRLKYYGTFNEDETRQITKGSLAMGYTSTAQANFAGRASQNDVMDFAANNRKKMGMDVDESMQVASIASQGATQNMQVLTQALTDVGQAAHKAGLNAADAKQNFEKAFAGALGNGVISTAAPGLAQASAQAAVGMGPQFKNSDQMGRMTGDAGYQAMVAGSMGITMSQFQMNNQTTTGQATNATAGSAMFLSRMRELLQRVNPDGLAWLDQQVASHGSSGEIANQYMAAHQGTQLPEQVLVSQAQMFAPEQAANLTTGQLVITYLCEQMKGHTLGAQLSGEAAKSGVQKINGTTDAVGDLNDLTKNDGKSTGATGFVKGLVGANGGDGPSDATKNFLAGIGAGGVDYGNVHQMLAGMTSKAESSQHVEVDTVSGKRVVTLADATKNFAAQLASGQAHFVDGDQAGNDITAYGGTADTSAQTTQAALDESKKNSDEGYTEDDWKKDHPNDKLDGSGAWTGPTQMFDLTPGAAKLLKLVPDDGTSPADNDNGGGGVGGAVKDALSTGIKFNPAGWVAHKALGF